MKTDKDQRGGLPGRISGRLPGGSSKTMTALRESETLTEMLCGEAIWSLLWAAGIVIFSKDRLHGIAGLAIGFADLFQDPVGAGEIVAVVGAGDPEAQYVGAHFFDDFQGIDGIADVL